MSVKAVGSRFLYEALFNGGYRLVSSYQVVYYGDKVLGQSSGARLVRFTAYWMDYFIKFCLVIICLFLIL